MGHSSRERDPRQGRVNPRVGGSDPRTAPPHTGKPVVRPAPAKAPAKNVKKPKKEGEK
jgi:hypothetical protein